MKKSAGTAADPDGGGRWSLSSPANSGSRRMARSNSTRSATAPARSSTPFSCRCCSVRRRRACPPVNVRTLHFLAPAITTELFKKRLKKLIGPGQPITRLTDLHDDRRARAGPTVAQPYGKSLLYLVSNAFEDAVPTPLLGLQKSLNRDLHLIRFFGLAGPEKVADIIFSKSPGTRSAQRAQPVDHPRRLRQRRRDHDERHPARSGCPGHAAPSPITSKTRSRGSSAAVASARSARPPQPGRRGAARGTVRRPGRAAVGAREAWTVMVWMAGDNDLESFGDKDLAEIKRVGSTDEANVVVQFDSMGDDRTRRYA